MTNNQTEVNFDADVYEYIAAWFSYLKKPLPTKTNLDDDLLNALTLQEKYIMPQPRHVFFSKELENYLSVNFEYARILNYLKLLFINGGDVNPHQSRDLFKFKKADNLIYDWKIYHFHLKTTKTRYPYFTDRTGKMLFAYVDSAKALFLGLGSHKPKEVFADKVWLEIIENNWKDVLTYANGIYGLSHNLTNEERVLMRQYHVNEAFIEVNGKFVFSPNLGLASSGQSNSAINKMMNLLNWANRNAEAINDHREIADAYFAARYNLTDPIIYKLAFAQKPGIIDLNSGKILIDWLEQFKSSV